VSLGTFQEISAALMS